MAATATTTTPPAIFTVNHRFQNGDGGRGTGAALFWATLRRFFVIDFFKIDLLRENRFAQYHHMPMTVNNLYDHPNRGATYCG
jgi:hypothetical protein